MKLSVKLVGLCFAAALCTAPVASGAILTYLSGPVFDGPMAQGSLDGGPAFDLLCIDSNNPIKLLSWPVEVLTLEQAAGSGNIRGFDLTTLKLIALASATMFQTHIFNFTTEKLVWKIGDDNLTIAQAGALGVDISKFDTFDYTGFRIFNPTANPDQQLFMGDPGDLGGGGGEIPEPSTSVMLGLGLAALGMIGRRKKHQS